MEWCGALWGSVGDGVGRCMVMWAGVARPLPAAILDGTVRARFYAVCPQRCRVTSPDFKAWPCKQCDLTT